MAGADKRAKLLSDLMAAKGGASGDGGAPAEPEQASVIQIAKRRPSEDRLNEAPAAPGVLYSKGAATASTFRPSYWSFDHEQQTDPAAEPVRAESPPPSPAPAAPAAHAPASRPLPVNFVIAFGCVALVVSTTLFVLSTWHRSEVPAAQAVPAMVAAAPASAAPAPLPPALPAESLAAPPAPTPAPTIPAPAPVLLAPTPTTPTPAPVPLSATPTVPTPAPAPVLQPPAPAPVPVASEPPPAPFVAAPIEEPPAEPAPTAASAPAPGPKPSPDSRQADALLARGDDLLVTGDVAAARLFYQRAAEQGSAAAATAVGQTYDPGVLEVLRVRGVRGDSQTAADWYRKAIAAGDRQAEIRLKRLLARTPG